MTNTLRFNRYQFICRTLNPLRLNDYSGSMLRGAFGWALKKTVCMTKMNDCSQCLLYRQCQYPQIFAPPPVNSAFQKLSQKPVPYIIEPPPLGRQQLKAGQTFHFNMVLIGPALEALPVLIHSWQHALARGLGKQQTPARLEQVVFEPGQRAETCVYQQNDGQLKPSPAFNPALPANSQHQRLSMTLTTPLRLKSRGKILSSALKGEDIIKALFRRYYLLQEFYSPDYQPPDFSELGQQALKINAEHQLKWHHWSRYSNRQQQTMPLGGVVGKIHLTGKLAPFLPLLYQGQWLHIGNKTSFGLGCYQLESGISC